MIEQIFGRIAVLSVVGACFGIILLILRPLTKKHFSSRWHYYTYTASLFIMLIPLAIHIPEKTAETKEIVQEKTYTVTYIKYDTQTAENTVKETGKTVDASQDAVKSNIDWYLLYKSALPFIAYIWLTGAVLHFLFILTSHLRFVTCAKRNASIFHCKEYGFPFFTVYKTSAVSSPTLAGVFRCRLFLPDTSYTEKELCNILAHEHIHYKRHDIAIKWLGLIVKSVHWFNPVVYKVAGLSNLECEISCDISATRSMDKEGICSYCETILSLISKKDKHTSPILCAGSTKKTLERRFKAIMEEKKTGKKAAVISAIAAGVIILSALTVSAIIGGKADKKEDTKESSAEITEEKEYTQEETDVATAEKDIPSGEITGEAEPVISYKVVESDEEIATLSTEKIIDGEDVEYKLIADDQSNVLIHPVLGIETDIPHGENELVEVTISAGFDKDRHPAVDYVLEQGTVIKSPIEGIITTAEYSHDKGNHIVIQSYNGETEILFAHLDKMHVSKGSKINAGDELGTVGTTGMSTGPHLHVEYKENSTAQDPLNIMVVNQDGEILMVYSKPEQIID